MQAKQSAFISSQRSSLRLQSRVVAGVSLLLVLATIPVADAQSGLRRLFSTPALRAELDRRRLSSLQSPTVIQLPAIVEPVTLEDLESEQPAADLIYAVGGSMRRSDGSYTVWINNSPMSAAELPVNMELLEPYSRGQLRIRNPENGASYVVNPGQVLNLTRGELMEAHEYRTRTTPAATGVDSGALIEQVQGNRINQQ